MFKSSNFNANSGNNLPKIFNPGTHYAHVVDMKLDAPPYKPESYFIVLTLEGVDLGEGFVGIPVDKMNPALGNYRGQIGNVRSGRYPFSTYTYEGREITRDEQIFRWVNNLAKQLGVLEKMNADNVEAQTIEEYVDAARKYIMNPEVWAHFTLAGQEYFTDGYDKPNYRLFFPKPEGKLFPFAAENENQEPVNLLGFDRAKHIIIKEQEPATTVESFGGQTTAQPDSMFDLSGNVPAGHAVNAFNTVPQGGFPETATVSNAASLNLP